MSTKKLKLALVGCGRISKNHFQSIAELREVVDLVAICDIKPEALAWASDFCGQQGFQPKTFSSYESMIKNSDIDVVSICTPSGLHPEQSILAAQYKKHIICEKPMATCWEDGIRMTMEAKQRGVKLFVVKQNRFNPTLVLLKKALDQGRFGKIYLSLINVLWNRGQDYYDQAPWRGTTKLDGGAVMNQASHYIDALEWLVGPIKNVFAFGETMARKIEMEDTAVASFRFQNGSIGSLNVTMLTYPKNLEGSLTLIGEKGTVRVGGIALNKITHWEFADQSPMDQEVEKANYDVTSVYGNGHPIYYKKAIETLLSKTENQVTSGNEGLISLGTIAAVYEAISTGKPVSPPRYK